MSFPIRRPVPAVLSLAAFCVLGGPLLGAGVQQPRPAPPPGLSPKAPFTFDETFGKLPLAFEPNLGQFEPGVRYVGRGPGYTVGLYDDRVVMMLPKAGPPSLKILEPFVGRAAWDLPAPPAPPQQVPVTMRFEGGRPARSFTSAQPLPGKMNYFKGNDPKKWVTKVPTHRRVTADGVYPGVDVAFYGNPHQLEYDFVVEPGVDPGVIRMVFEGHEGLELLAGGDLRIATAAGPFVVNRPHVFEEVAGQRTPIDSSFRLLADGSVGFRIEAFDRRARLVIDPALVFDAGFPHVAFRALTRDPFGNLVAAGTGFDGFQTTPGSAQPALGGAFDMAVAKTTPDGSSLLFASFLGGDGQEEAYGVALDGGGNVCLAGYTTGGTFPGVPQPIGISYHAVVAKLSPDGGQLLYAAVPFEGVFRGVAASAGGVVYAAGTDDTPVYGDAVVVAFGLSGQVQAYRALTASLFDDAYAVVLDASGLGSVWVAGETNSDDFPKVTPLSMPDATLYDSQGFVTRLSLDLQQVLFSTFFGGSQGGERVSGIALDSQGNVAVVGSTSSPDFPQVGGLGVEGTAFVARLSTTSVLLSTKIVASPNGYVIPGHVAVDSADNIYFTLYLENRVDPFGFADPIWEFSSFGFPDLHPVSLGVLSASGDTLLFSTALQPVLSGGIAPAVVVTGVGDILLAGAGPGGLSFPGSTYGGHIVRIAPGGAEVRVTATVDHDPLLVGDTVPYTTFTASVANLGPSTSQLTHMRVRWAGGLDSIGGSGPLGASCSTVVSSSEVSYCTFPPIPPGETRSVNLYVLGLYPSRGTSTFEVEPSGTELDKSDNLTTLETTVVDGIAELGLTGTSLPSPPLVGSPLTYSLTVTNAGPDPAPSTKLTGTLQVGVLRESITPSAGTCSFTPSGFTCNLGTVAGGTAQTVDVVVRPLQAGTVSSSSSVDSLALDNNLTDNDLTLSDTAVSSGVADLSVTLADAPDPLSVGNTLTYTATVANAGPDPAPNATVVLALDPAVTPGVPVPSQGTCSGTGPFTCNLGTIASGGNASVSLPTTTAAAKEAAISSASVYSDASDPALANNTASATTRIALPGADVKVTMVANHASVLTDEDVTYTITVANLGLDPANAVTLTSILTGGDVNLFDIVSDRGTCGFEPVATCHLGTMAAGEVANITATGLKSSPGTLTNTAAVTTTSTDPVAANNTAVVTTTIVQRQADVAVVTTVAPSVGYVGQTATFTITVTNFGPQEAVQVSLVHDLDASQQFVSLTGSGCTGAAHTTCAFGNLASGETRIVTVTALLLAAGTATGSSTVTNLENDPVLANNASSTSLPVSEAADLAVTNVDAPDPLDAGSTITYTIAVRNNGPSPATAVALTASLDATTTPVSATASAGTCALGQTVACSLGTIASGSTVTVEVKAKTTVPGTVTSVATATSPVADIVPSNGSATATTTVRPVADLAITATDAVDPIPVGATASYALTVQNLGPFVATTAQARFELPAGTALVSGSGPGGACTVAGSTVSCPIGSLAVGTTASLSVLLSASQAGLLTVVFRATNVDTDPDGTNNTAAVRTSVDAAGGDLSILKSHTGTFSLGGSGRFTFTVRRLSSQPVATALKLGSVANSRFGTDLTLDGSRMTATRAKLLSTSNFGASGPSLRPIALTDVAGTLTRDVLAGFDVFFVGYLNDDNARKLTAAELDAFKAYVNDGGTVIATCDDFNFDAVCNAFGYYVLSTLPPSAPITPTTDGQAHPIFQGPFGTVPQYNGYQTVGYFASPAPGVSILARDPSGKALLMTRRMGQGQVVFMSDVDNIGGALTPGSTITSDNDRLLGNLFAYAGRTGTPVVTDHLPAGLTYASAAGASCLADGSVVTCVLPPVAPGATSTFTLDVNVGVGAFARVANVGTLAMPGDTNASNDSSTDLVDVAGGAAVPKGDLNLSGQRDVFDLVILANYLVGNYQAGTSPFLATAATADLNGDGLVDVFDLVLLANCIVAGGNC